MSLPGTGTEGEFAGNVLVWQRRRGAWCRLVHETRLRGDSIWLGLGSQSRFWSARGPSLIYILSLSAHPPNHSFTLYHL